MLDFINVFCLSGNVRKLRDIRSGVFKEVYVWNPHWILLKSVTWFSDLPSLRVFLATKLTRDIETEIKIKFMFLRVVICRSPEDKKQLPNWWLLNQLNLWALFTASCYFNYENIKAETFSCNPVWSSLVTTWKSFDVAISTEKCSSHPHESI